MQRTALRGTATLAWREARAGDQYNRSRGGSTAMEKDGQREGVRGNTRTRWVGDAERQVYCRIPTKHVLHEWPRINYGPDLGAHGGGRYSIYPWVVDQI